MASAFVIYWLACYIAQAGKVHWTTASCCRNACRYADCADKILGVAVGCSTIAFDSRGPHLALVVKDGCALWVSGVDNLVSAISSDNSCCSRLWFQMARSPICVAKFRHLMSHSKFFNFRTAKQKETGINLTNVLTKLFIVSKGITA